MAHESTATLTRFDSDNQQEGKDESENEEEDRENVCHTNIVAYLNGTENRHADSSVHSSSVSIELQNIEGPDYPDGDEALTKKLFTPLMNSNHYTTRKMAAQTMIDVALMMANISQLRTLLAGGERISYYIPILVLVIFSIVSQLTFGILIFILWARENDATQLEQHRQSLKDKMDKPDVTPADMAALKRQCDKLESEQETHDLITNRFNYSTMILVFLITVTNMFITGLGLESSTLIIPDSLGVNDCP